MEGAQINCGKRIVDSLIGRKVNILGYEQNIPKGHKLILGDMATITLLTKNTTIMRRDVKERLRRLGYIQ